MSSSRHRRRLVDLGGFRAVKIGTPPARSDLYYATMALSWPTFVALVSASFVLINVSFGLLYALLPGAITNAAPGSVADGFFFSVETLGTVGYGNMAPVTPLGHVIAAGEILVGLFFSATMTGLVFARFARPRTSFIFSNIAIVGQIENRAVLMIRLASTRLRPIANVNAQLSWLQRKETSDGRTYRSLIDLPLRRSHNPQLAFAWLLIHEIEDASPMLNALRGEDAFRLTVSVSGIDTLLASQALGGRAYNRSEIVIDQEFDDMIDDSADLFEFDLTKLHDSHPRPVPTSRHD